MGGVTLPYLARLGYPIPPFDFSVPGVTSISVDLHKFGYTGKGASVIVHRTKERCAVTRCSSPRTGSGHLRLLGAARHEVRRTDGRGVGGAPPLGDDGYLRLAGAARAATEELASGIREHPALVLRAEPDAMLLAFGAADPDQLDVFTPLAGLLWRRAGTSIARDHHRRSTAPSTRSTRDGSKSSWATSTMPCRRWPPPAPGRKGAYGTVE